MASAGPGGARRGTSRRTPGWLWVAAGLILIPIALPIVALMVRVIGASEAALSVLLDARTLELLARSLFLTALVTA